MLNDSLQSVFIHCPQCGAETVQIERNHRIFCTACHFEFFHNVATAVGALIIVRDSLLLLERAKEPAQGTYALPGGFVDPGESLEAALRRECKEEIGWFPDYIVPQYFCSFPNTYLYKGILYNTCDSFFIIRQDDLEISSLSLDAVEVSSPIIIPLHQIKRENLAFESTRLAVNGLIQT